MHANMNFYLLLGLHAYSLSLISWNTENNEILHQRIARKSTMEYAYLSMYLLNFECCIITDTFYVYTIWIYFALQHTKERKSLIKKSWRLISILYYKGEQKYNNSLIDVIVIDHKDNFFSFHEIIFSEEGI